MKLSSQLLFVLAFLLAFGVGISYAKEQPRRDDGNTNLNANLNANKNTVRNRNLNAQGQLQGQGQAQSNSMTNTNAGNATASVAGSGNSAVYEEDLRELPIPSTVNVGSEGGPQLNYQPDEDTGPNFMAMENLVDALNAIDLDVAGIADEGDIQMVTQVLASAPAQRDSVERPVFAIKGPGRMRVAYPDFSPLAVVSLKADDDNTMNSATLAVKLAKYAQSIGATRIFLVKEGVARRLKSWGIGLGLSYNMASVGSDNSDSGMVGAGGTGWSMGQGEFVKLPFMTAIVGR